MREHARYFDILRRFDTPTVANAIELFDARPRAEGYLDGSIRALFPRLPPIVGFATTATFRSAEPAREGDVYAGFPDQIERFLAEVEPPRIVVFQDLDPVPAGATFGEVMCSAYKAFGCAGLITSGAARDLEQVERIAFPCFASSVVASHANCRLIDVNVPVSVGGVEIRPGDVLHADANGVTTIPRDLVGEIALASERFVEAETEVIEYLRGAAPTVDGLRAAQSRCRERFARIPDDVRRKLAGG